MLWQVRALIEDRPGSLADLAVACGDRAVNILGLQIFPAPDGRVVDELVLHTPGGWSAEDVARMCATAGVSGPTVTPCPPQALEDQAVRYLRAAQVVGERPDLLEDQLARLLDADVAADAGEPGALVLDDALGPSVALSRPVPFSDTEAARAGELRRVAAVALGLMPPTTEPVVAESSRTESTPTLRAGGAADVRAVVAMHARCSAETVRRRYHAPVPHLSSRLARAVLDPPGGASLVLTVGYDVVALGTFAPDPSEEDGRTAELGVMVEDRWQRRGLGTRLLRALSVEAAGRGFEMLTCHVQPDNEAVMPTIRRSGLRVRATFADGLTQYRIPVGSLGGTDAGPRRRGNRPAMGEVTAGLTSLLHTRRELREIHPAADLIDQAVRGGA
ncbi:MAG TPA: GNAT family N-acetyltransferase [Nocardioidaceae bacterium]